MGIHINIDIHANIDIDIISGEQGTVNAVLFNVVKVFEEPNLK